MAIIAQLQHMGSLRKPLHVADSQAGALRMGLYGNGYC